MRRTLAFLFLFTWPALAETRQPFPADYKPSPCASVASVCKTFPQSQFSDIAALRGFDIGQEWVDAHWKELNDALAPACAKIATCFAAPDSDFTFCNDVVSEEAFATTCTRYPEGSQDREKCNFFVRVYFFGHDRHSSGPWKQMQECTKTQPASGERTFEWWVTPESIGSDYNGSFTVYAIDSETKVPVRARVHLNVKDNIYAPDSADGKPTAFYPVPWKPKFVRVPNADGHRDITAPEVRVEAPGYKPVTFTLKMDIPQWTVTMDPDPSKLKSGKNTVTITARDAATGTPVEARVMGGASVLGKTNVPFVLEIAKGQKRPEIWITSLYDRYNDVVVAKSE